MTTTAAYRPPTRDRYTGLRPCFDALMRKKDASLAGGAYGREPRPGVTTTCPAALRSRWAAVSGSPSDAPLGMGILQGVLAVLTGAVRSLSWDTDGRTGRATITGVGSAETYQMSFDDTRPDYRLFGGFVNGPAYQATVMGLVVLWAQRETRPDRSEEVLRRWWQLLAALDAVYPRRDPATGWDAAQLKAACQDMPRTAAVRTALAQLCDALYFALRYDLPDLRERGLYVQYDPCVTGTAGTAITAAGSVLLLPTRPPTAPSTPVPSAATPADEAEEDGDDADLTLDTDDADAAEPPTTASSAPTTAPSPPITAPSPPKPRKPRRARATRAPEAVPVAAVPEPVPPADPVVAEPPTTPPPSLIGGALQVRIARAFTRPGDVFLFGVTATGKTTWAKTAAISHGFGLEIVVFKPGLKDEMLYGSLVNQGGSWVWHDGPIVRAARRAAAGEPVVLLLDELPRGDRSIIAGTMELLNTYSRADLDAQALPVPLAPGPYRVIRVVDTQETLVVPATALKLVATANLGDRYVGMDLSDPAFRRRWSGGWIELAGYGGGETAAILAEHLALPASHALIQALVQVDQAVQAYQRTEESLVMTTNLSTLIGWGQEILRQLDGLTPAPARPYPSRTRVTEAFVTAAQDLWIDMLCPLAGDRRDPEIYRALLAIVEHHAPDLR